MGQFKDISDYFKALSINNKLVAHTVVAGGEERNSFFRMNDDEELAAGCVNWAHFPCVVHFGFSGRYAGNSLVPKRKQNNVLWFLDKCDLTDMASRETAFDRAFEVMEQFISRMNKEFIVEGSCSVFRNLDLSRFSFSPVGPIGATLVGWELAFEDEASADDVANYDDSKWF